MYIYMAGEQYIVEVENFSLIKGAPVFRFPRKPLNQSASSLKNLNLTSFRD